MATEIVPFLPDERYDPSFVKPAEKYQCGALKDPLVHYNQVSRILTDLVIGAGAGGVLTAPGVFGSRVVFNGTSSGAWQLPTAIALLTEINSSVFGALFPKRTDALGQSYEVLALFRNDTNAQISLTTNTGLTLHPSPLLIPANSSIRVIFEVVGSTYATAAFNVYVENGGGGANAPNSINITTNPALTVALTGNTYNIGINGPINNVAATNLELAWNPTLMTFETRGVIQEQWFDLFFGTVGDTQALTTTYATVLWPRSVLNAAVATYNAGTGVLTIVKPGPWVFGLLGSTLTVPTNPAGLTPALGTVPSGQRVSLILTRNNQTIMEVSVGDEGLNSGCLVFNLSVGDALKVVAAQSGGTLTALLPGTYWTGGPLY
jgi:hypothetical protein